MRYTGDEIYYVKHFASKDLFTFFCEFWHIVEPSKKLQVNWHIKELCHKLQSHAERVAQRLPREKHLVINIPPGTTKSTLVSVMYPAWAWTQWPWMKFITGSFDESLALRDAVKSRDIIKSELYQYSFGDRFKLKLDVNKKSEYANDKGGFRVATSVSGSITGYHADIWIIDDPIDPRGAKSQAEIQQTKDWMDLTIPTRMTDLNISVQIMIMQRLADEDPTGLVLKRGDWEHVCLPAESGDNIVPKEYEQFYDDGLLDPIRLSRQVLTSQRITLGSKGYAAQYLQRTSPEGGNLFKQAWFNRFNMFDLQRESVRFNEPVVWHFKADTAYTDKTVNDPSGFIAYCYIQDNLYIRDYTTVRKEMPELVIFCKDYAIRNGYSDQSTFKIEPKANGISLVQMLKSSTGLNITKAPDPVGDKTSRANLIVPRVEAGRVFLLDGSSWIDAFLHEVCTFPDAAHDEAVDLLSMTLREKVIDKSGGWIGLKVL